MNDVQNKFTELIEGNRLMELKNEKRDEDLETFITESRNRHQEQEQKQSNTDASIAFNKKALNALLNAFNINLSLPSPPSIITNAINNNTHQHPQQQNLHH